MTGNGRQKRYQGRRGIGWFRMCVTEGMSRVDARPLLNNTLKGEGL
jgi:hypothetical protein